MGRGDSQEGRGVELHGVNGASRGKQVGERESKGAIATAEIGPGPSALTLLPASIAIASRSRIEA